MSIKCTNNSSGMSLTEVMVALAIIAIAFLGMLGAFGNITKSIQYSKYRTLASNLAQEKMQQLKQISYYRLMITTTTYYRTEFTPWIPYDNYYYAPENVYEGGINFERLTYIRMTAPDVSGNLALSASSIDTGLKNITVTVIWKQGEENKKLQVTSVRANPNTVISNANLSGVVSDSVSLLPIEGALVTLAENMGWRGITNSSGTYAINFYSGSYGVSAYKKGYFPSFQQFTIGGNQNLAMNFSLIPMSSGTVAGSVWYNDHLVISQVVASTVSAVTGWDQEYIELFNPTTSYVQMSAGLNVSLVKLYYQNNSDGGILQGPASLAYSVIDSSVAPGNYFLIANTTTVNVGGVWRQADAVYSSAPTDKINLGEAGAVEIQDVSGNWLDRVGWNKTNFPSQTAPFYETSGINLPNGFLQGEQFVRRASTSAPSDILGRAYDSGNNNIDFVASIPMIWQPKNKFDFAPVVSGVPAFGSIVTCNDELSEPAVAVFTGAVPYAGFQLNEVSTGSWIVLVSSSYREMTISPVSVVTNGQIVGIPNSATTPAWPYANFNSCVLSDIATCGYISGRVTNSAGTAINPGIIVNAPGGGQTTANNSTGRYLLPIATGTYSVIANPNNTNNQYVWLSMDGVIVNLGQITSSIDFILSQGGMLSGWVTRDGTNSLPGVSIVAKDINGMGRAQDVSKTDGTFLLINLSTGAYTVEPILDSGEKSSPLNLGGNVSIGTTVNVGTFTIIGAYGHITGQVTNLGQPISTGVLIVASTSTITSIPVISSAMAAGGSIYTSNSYENGTYVIDVRGSTTTTYNVYAFYPTISGGSVSISTGTSSAVSVLPSQTISGIDFSW